MKFNIFQNKYEINNHFLIRKKIINFLKPKTNKDLIYYNNLSNIFINIIFFRCKYDKKTENKIFDIVKKMKNNNLGKLIPIDYNSLKFNELKELLKKKKLLTTGKKVDLIKRLELSS